MWSRLVIHSPRKCTVGASGSNVARGAGERRPDGGAEVYDVVFDRLSIFVEQRDASERNEE
jgi:hypothetical protein